MMQFKAYFTQSKSETNFTEQYRFVEHIYLAEYNKSIEDLYHKPPFRDEL